MPGRLTPLLASRSGWFDLAVLGVGVVIAGYCASLTLTTGFGAPLWPWLAVPVIVLVARFPVVLVGNEGGVEVGFDSCVLMFLLCVKPLPLHDALLIWSVGVVLTQATTQKRPIAKAFNIGIGIIGGGVASMFVDLVRGDRYGQLVELLAVVGAAACYFAVDFILSAVSLALETRTSLKGHLVQSGSLFVLACFVPFDSLGYLAAIVNRDSHPSVIGLLAVPLVMLLIATRAVSRGAENARRLTVLFDAAVGAQKLSDPRQVLEAVVEDGRRLLKIQQVDLRPVPPSTHEIGAQVNDGQRDHWIVSPGRHRARSTTTADQQALEALAAVSAAAFERLRLTENMTHLARHDLLTGLPNRGLLLDRVEHALQMSRRRSTQLALLFVDLDEFKPVNDRFGHAAGDAVLVDIAERLLDCVRQSDTVARLGGDEFALLLEDVHEGEVSSACNRILTAMQHGTHVAGHEISLSASIGVAFGDSSETAESMLRNADLAMYEAKARGRSQFVEYERSLGRSRLQKLELVESLRAALAAGDLHLVYQPIVRAATGRITGVEALARWRLNGEPVPTDLFIRVAEEAGMMVLLGDVVLANAARDAPFIRDAAGGDVNVSVNISAKQLREPDFVEKVEAARARMGGTGLVLEITERESIGDDEASLEAMKTLAGRGVPFAIDDFGIGFSSIGYLQDMPVQIIKTDLSFSEGIDRDERSCALLCSITMMGQALGLDVVVEGIERTTQLEHLLDHVHAPYAQGYLMHRPMPLDQLVEVLRANRTAVEPTRAG